MPIRKSAKHKRRGLIAKLRKPTAPPARIIEDKTKYDRARERERLRGEAKSPNRR